MTVLCLVELDGAGAADASLRALTFARFAQYGRMALVNGAVGVVTALIGGPFFLWLLFRHA